MKPLDPRLLPHLRPAAGPLATTVVAQVAVGLATVGQAVALGACLVAFVTDPAGSAWHQPAAWFALASLARAGFGMLGDLAARAAAGRVTRALRRRLLECPPTHAHRVGEVTLLTTRGLSAIEPWVTRYLPTLVTAAVLPAATVATIAVLDPLSAVIVALTLPLVPVFAVLVGLSTRDRADAQWRSLQQLAGHFLDVVRGLPTLVVHRRAEAQVARVREVSERHRVATLATLRVAFASTVTLELIATVSVALVAVVVGLRLAAGGMDFETALVVLLLAPEAYWPLRRVGAEFHAAAEGVAAFEAASALLDARSEPASAPGSAQVGEAAGTTLRLESLTLGYDGRAVVEGLDAVLSPGLTAITGPSGCGKSTLLVALTGALAPMGGRILLDGVGPALDDPEGWRRQVAWAPQRPWLTSGTIAANLRLGRPEASDADLWRALDDVDLAHAVAAMPGGLDTVLGEDGAGLSAGQRARVALARVLVADRPFVVLDEPSAHLDAETEAILLATLRRLAARATVVVVAHRDAVVEAADRVIALPATLAPAPGLAVEERGSAGTPQATPPSSSPASEQRPVGPWCGRLLGAAASCAGVALTATAAWLITRAAAHPPVLTLMVAIVAVRTFGLARPVLRYFERLASHDAALGLLAERRAAVYAALVGLVPGRIGRRGDVLSRVVDDVDTLLDEELRVRQPWWTAAFVAAGTIGFAAWQSPDAGLVAAVVTCVAVAAAGAARLAARRGEPAFVTARSRMSGLIAEHADGWPHLIAWQATSASLDRIDEASRAVEAAQRVGVRAAAAARAVVVLACAGGVLAMAWSNPAVGPAMAALLSLLPLALAEVLLPLVDAAVLGARTGAARRSLDELLAQPPRVRDEVEPDSGAGSVARAGVQLCDVTAGWDDDRPVLRGVELDVAPGRRVGVVGPSGSGKSTLAALLPRFLDPTAGSVRLGGRGLRDLPLDRVRGAVGWVDDDPYLFSSTLVENVRLARPGADDDAVAAALRTARLGNWLAALPDGLHTWVGEGHRDVSGGERARIGLARALLADAPVLVLDEPTAHLDAATAAAVADDLLGAADGRAVVWITHTRHGLDRMDAVLRLGGAAQSGRTPTASAAVAVSTSASPSR